MLSTFMFNKLLREWTRLFSQLADIYSIMYNKNLLLDNIKTYTQYVHFFIVANLSQKMQFRLWFLSIQREATKNRLNLIYPLRGIFSVWILSIECNWTTSKSMKFSVESNIISFFFEKSQNLEKSKRMPNAKVNRLALFQCNVKEKPNTRESNSMHSKSYLNA